MAQCCRVRTNEGRVAQLQLLPVRVDQVIHQVNTGHILLRYYVVMGVVVWKIDSCAWFVQKMVQKYPLLMCHYPLGLECVWMNMFLTALVCVCVVGESRKSCRRWGVEGPAVSLSVSLTRVYVVDAHTLLTADVAAPVEDAVTLLFAFLSPGVVAASAAQQVAALNAVRRHVADTIARPKGARLWVGLAEIGRALVVHQIALSGVLEEGVLDSQGLHPATRLAVLLHHHL